MDRNEIAHFHVDDKDSALLHLHTCSHLINYRQCCSVFILILSLSVVFVIIVLSTLVNGSAGFGCWCWIYGNKDYSPAFRTLSILFRFRATIREQNLEKYELFYDSSVWLALNFSSLSLSFSSPLALFMNASFPSLWFLTFDIDVYRLRYMFNPFKKVARRQQQQQQRPRRRSNRYTQNDREKRRPNGRDKKINKILK